MTQEKITSEGEYIFPDGSVMTYTIVNGYHLNISGTLGDGEIHLENDDKITFLEIKEGVSSIGAFNFSGWSQLKYVDFPKGIKSIGHRAFYGCKNCKWHWFGSGLESIDSEAFKGCSSLLFINFPESLQSIGDKAFESCDNLKLAVMPRSRYVKIGADAFGAGVEKIDRPLKNARGARIAIGEIKPNTYYDYSGCTVDIHVTVYSSSYKYRFSFWLLDHDTGWTGESIMDGIYESEVECNDDFDEDMELSDIYTDEELEKMAWDEIMDNYEFHIEDCPFLDCINDVECVLEKKYETQFEDDGNIEDSDIDYLLEDDPDFFWEDLEEEDLIDFNAMPKDEIDYKDYVEDFEKKAVFSLNPPEQEAKAVSLPDAAIEYCAANPADCLLLPYVICKGISGTHFVQPRGILRKVNRILTETDWADKDAAEAALLSIRKYLLKRLKRSRWVDVECYQFSRYENYKHEVNEAGEELETLTNLLSKLCPDHGHSVERRFDFGPDRSGDILRLQNECNAIIPEKIAYDFLVDRKIRTDYSAQMLHFRSSHYTDYDKTRLEFIQEEMFPFIDRYLEDDGNGGFFDAGLVMKEYEGETIVRDILEAESDDDYYKEDNGLVLSHGICYCCHEGGTLIEVTSNDDHPYRGEVHIPSSIMYNGKQCTVNRIDSYAFNDCSELKKVVIEDGLTEISDEAFVGCSQLAEVTLPESLRAIGALSFENCTGLKSIFIPKNVESLDVSCFEGCTQLAEIVVDESNATFTSVEGVLCDRSSGGRIYVPDANRAIDDSEEITHGEIIEESDDVFSVDGIRYELFENSKIGLRVLPLKDGVKYSGRVEIPAKIKYHKRWRDVVEIDDDAFKDCPELTEINIPCTVSEFSPVRGCQNLVCINVAEGNPTYRSLDGVLYSVRGRYGAQRGSYSELHCYPLAHGESEFVFPEFVDSLLEGAFEGCQDLKSVVISDKVTCIPSDAFKDCKNLECITWGAKLECIWDGAFENCTALKSIAFTDSIEQVSSNAFRGCTNITSLTFAKGRYFYLDDLPDEFFPWKKDAFVLDGVRYRPYTEHFKEGGATLYVCDFEEEDIKANIDSGVHTVSIPASIEHYGFLYKVTDCGTSFGQFPSLRRLELPETVKKCSISGIKTLQEVVVDDANTEYSARDGMLCDKQAKTLFSVPRGRDARVLVIPDGVEVIDEKACCGNPYIEELIIPDNNVSIKRAAFADCSSLRDVHLGKGDKKICIEAFAYTAIERFVITPQTRFTQQHPTWEGKTAFYGSKLKAFELEGEHEVYTVIDGILYIKNSWGLSLRLCPPAYEGHLQIPEGASSVGMCACWGCTELQSVFIPEGVGTIGDDAFSGCTKLENVELDGHIDKIGSWAFSGCTSLKEIDCIGAKDIEDTAFAGDKGLKLNLPFALEKDRSKYEKYMNR